jgi:hypothetical protein
MYNIATCHLFRLPSLFCLPSCHQYSFTSVTPLLLLLLLLLLLSFSLLHFSSHSTFSLLYFPSPSTHFLWARTPVLPLFVLALLRLFLRLLFLFSFSISSLLVRVFLQYPYFLVLVLLF